MSMRATQRRARFSINRAARLFSLDALERRVMLDGETVQTAVPPVLANTAAPAANAITLNHYFNDTTLPGTLATFNTSLGTIQVALTDAATPQTVANFLSYVDSGAYDNTIFHRSVDLNSGNGGSPTDSATIIQGGGYSIMNGSIGHIATNNPVPDEYTTELYGDVAGTLAMAKTSLANSATSEWYFNVTDNTELDTPTTDSNGVTTSYTVFGKVLSGQSFISTIAALPTLSIGSDLTNVPVTGITEAQVQAGASPNANNLVYTTGITTEPGTSYTATSDNKALVTPSLSNGVLSFAYGQGLSGTANITVVGTNLDGTSASTTIAVTVPNSATPNAGPVANPFTAPPTSAGTTGVFSVLGPDTDSLAALNPTSVTIASQPTNGTASVNSTNGFIVYTPNPGYAGADSLTYVVSDTAGNVSAPGTVTLFAAPGPVQVNVTATNSLTFTQPDGITGHISVTGGVAQVTFTNYQVSTSTHGGVTRASGVGADITDITISNTRIYSALNITSNGPLIIGTINNAGDMTRINAPTTTLTGNFSIGFITQFTVAALNGAIANFGSVPSGLFTNLTIPNVINSDLNATGNLGLVKSTKWAISDSQKHKLTAAFINDLEVPGIFDEDLSLTYDKFALARARVTDPTGTWTLAGAFELGYLGTPGSNWSLSVGSAIDLLFFTGDLNNQLTASNIGTIIVKGKTTNSVIQTDGAYDSRFLQVGRLIFDGPVSNSVIFAAGNLGKIIAPSLSSSRIYAGVNISVAQSGALATAATDLSNNALIESVTLGHGAKAFSNSIISADEILALSLGRIVSSNNGNIEGVSAHLLARVLATLVPGGGINAGIAQLKTAATLAAYEKKAKLALGDFQINIF